MWVGGEGRVVEEEEEEGVGRATSTSSTSGATVSPGDTCSTSSAILRLSRMLLPALLTACDAHVRGREWLVLTS